MIEKMKVVHIVAAASEKTALLDKLRELGVVHFAEKASADQRYLERFARLSRMEMTLQEYPKAKQETTVLSDSEFEAFYQQLSDCMERKRRYWSSRPPLMRRRKSWPNGAGSFRRSCGS